MRKPSRQTTGVKTARGLVSDIGVVAIHARYGDSDDAATCELGAAVIDIAALEKFARMLRAQSKAPRKKRAR